MTINYERIIEAAESAKQYLDIADSLRVWSLGIGNIATDCPIVVNYDREVTFRMDRPGGQRQVISMPLSNLPDRSIDVMMEMSTRLLPDYPRISIYCNCIVQKERVSVFIQHTDIDMEFADRESRGDGNTPPLAFIAAFLRTHQKEYSK